MRYDRNIVSIGIGVIAGLAVYFAVSAAAQLSQNSVSTITTVLSDGRTQFTLHNYASQPITAYSVESVLQTTTGERHKGLFNDSEMEVGVAPIAPGGEESLIVALPGQHPNVQLGAVLFKGGSSYGNAAWVTRLKNQRTDFVQTLDVAASDVAALASQSTNSHDLAQRLDQQKQARISTIATPMTTDSRDLKGMLTQSYYIAEQDILNSGKCGASVPMAQCGLAVANDLKNRTAGVGN